MLLADIAALRTFARADIQCGATTIRDRADREIVVKLLNAALATEVVCALGCRCHYFMAGRIPAHNVAQQFLLHSNEKQAHADQIATRIIELGGTPDFSPDGLSCRSHAQYVEAANLIEMISGELASTRLTIDWYHSMARFLGDDDPTTRWMLQSIVAIHEEHAEDLGSLLAALSA